MDSSNKEVQVYSEAEQESDLRKYAAQLMASDGFDVENFPKLRQVMYGMLVPLSPPYDDIAHECTDFAIDEYNKKNPIKIHLVKVLKANAELCGMANFYITFVAEDDNGDSKTFQAKVFDGVADDDGTPDRELTSIRIKHDSQVAASS